MEFLLNVGMQILPERVDMLSGLRLFLETVHVDDVPHPNDDRRRPDHEAEQREQQNRERIVVVVEFALHCLHIEDTLHHHGPQRAELRHILHRKCKGKRDDRDLKHRHNQCLYVLFAARITRTHPQSGQLDKDVAFGKRDPEVLEKPADRSKETSDCGHSPTFLLTCHKVLPLSQNRAAAR